MRVIAGSARGMKLTAPPGRAIRPTLDRVREALFSILGPDYSGVHFLDLFAGTGANGIEALSRGAASATFIDGETSAIMAIRANLAHTRFEGTVLRLRIPDEVRRIPGRFHLVFIDPPYDFTGHEELLRGLVEAGLLHAGAIVVVEHDAKAVLPGACPGLAQSDQRTYGQTRLTFYTAA